MARPGIRAHRSRCLAPQDHTRVDGIPCATVPATLLAIAAAAPPNVLDSACNRAEMDGLLDMRAIDELLRRRRSHPGASRLRAALEVDGLGSDRTKSKLERRFLRLTREMRLPAPAINAWMPITGEEMQCDFVWHRERLVVEVDAWETHRTRKAFRRDRVLRRAGWDVVRITGHDVDQRTDEIVGDVRAMLEQRAAQNLGRS